MENGSINSGQARKGIFTRDFVLGFIAFFFFLTAINSLVPTLPIYLARLGSNEREIGILIGIFAIAALISRLFVGHALLRHRAKSVIMTGALLAAGTFVAYVVFYPFWPFFIIRFLQGITMGCIDTAVFASMIIVVPLAYRTRALGYLMLAFSLATAVAAPLGMFIINRYNFTALFLSCAILCFCALFLSWRTKGQKVSVPQKNSHDNSISFLNLKIITPAITSFLQFFVWGAVMAFFPLHAVRCGVANPGHFFSAMAIMMIAGRLFGGKIMDTCNKEKLIIAFLPSMVVLLIILSFSKTLPLFIIVGAIWGIGAAFFVPVAMAYALEYSGSSSGTAVGTFRALQDLGMALGPVVSGMIIPLTGYPGMFLFLAFICSINLCYFQFFVRKRGNVTGLSRKQT